MKEPKSEAANPDGSPALASAHGSAANDMATRKETVRICDVCKKRVSDEGETHYGGHPHNGWFALHQTGGSTDLDSLKKVRDWDVCGVKCLRKLSATIAA